MNIRICHNILSMSFLFSHSYLVIRMSGKLVFSWRFKGIVNFHSGGIFFFSFFIWFCFALTARFSESAFMLVQI